MFAKILQKQIDYTIKVTTDKFMKLCQLYNDKINMTIETHDFKPMQQKIPISISGLYDKNSYVNTSFCKLTTHTHVILNITPKVTCTIDFYHKKNEKLLIKCIKRIYAMINVFGNRTHINKYNGTSFYVLLFDAPRIMTAHYRKTSNEINIIGKKNYFNCTCGYASLFDNTPPFTICVTRMNGCLGLLVHEMCHICEMDLGEFKDGGYLFPYDRLSDWKHIAKTYFDLSPSCKIGNMTEGINNGNSSIIHAMFTAIENNNNKKELINEYKKCYARELLHSINQMLLLLQWFKYKSLNELLSKNTCKYVQTSMLFEYIIIRCIYLINFSDLDLFTRTIEQKEDKKYLQNFVNKLRTSIPYIDECLHNIPKSNKTIISMEYYAST